jgi:sulfide:quinone oxidoreductase
MQHRVVILGGGVGGTLLANLLARKLPRGRAQITLVDQTGQHLYQPGWLYLPFGEMRPEQLLRSERTLLSKRVDLRVTGAERIDPTGQSVALDDGTALPYDTLVVATGARLAPEVLPGYAEAAHHFYSPEAALRLGEDLRRFKGGRIVIGVADLPYKCPPAPLEFAFLLEAYLGRRGLREATELTYLSPIGRAFTIEPVSEFVTPLLAERGIAVQTFFNTESIDSAARTITSLEGDTLAYDLLVLIPPHRGARVVSDSGLGDEQGWLPTDRATLHSKAHPAIYGLGDATDLPVSKSGSAAHFEAQVIAERVASAISAADGHAPAGGHTYDGHVLCFLETGHGQATQLVFDYQHPPKPPRPNPVYHLEKALFNRAYWHLVPRGRV